MKLPFISGHYEGRSSNVSPRQCINYFYEKGVDDESLVATHGATTLNATGGSEVRGGIEYNNLAYFVVGNTLYELDAAGTKTSRGTINTTIGQVSLAHNGVRAGANQQIMIVDGVDGWIYDNTTSTLSQITDSDFVATESVVFMDGYFVFTGKGTDRFWITNLYDGTTITATDFFTAEGSPDETLSLVADRRELFIFGKQTLEVWYNSGDTDDTFQRFQGGFTQTGCAAAFSAVRFDNSVAWLTQNERGNVMVATLANGYQPKIISTPEINYQMSTYEKVDDAFAYSYQDEGHEFYVLTFPTANVTWVYDAATQQWHQRGHTIDGVFGRERYNCHVFAFGRHLFGDLSNGNIYQQDKTVGTISGTRIPRVAISANITDEENRIRISSVQLDMEEGIGDGVAANDTGMWLSWSKNSGHTYGNEQERSAGDLGDYARRLIWRRPGQARNWTFRLRTWTPYPHVLKGLYGKRIAVKKDGRQ